MNNKIRQIRPKDKVTLQLLTLSQMTNFRLLQTERVSDDNFKFDENGREFSKRVENTAGNGETAHCEQFLLFTQYFAKDLYRRYV